MFIDETQGVLREFKRAVSAGAAYDDLEIGPVPAGERWYIEDVCNIDETTAITSRQVGIKSGGFIYWLYGHAVTTAALPHGYRRPFIVVAGESIVCRLTGCTSADVLYAYLVGLYAKVSE